MVSPVNMTSFSNHRVYIAPGVDKNFSDSVLSEMQTLENSSAKTSDGISKLENIIILKNSGSEMPDEFRATSDKLHKHAEDAYGFVSRNDNAIVIIQDNHERKDVALEGDMISQGADTLAHETGHLVDTEYSTSDEFKAAYLEDLKNIEQMMKEGGKVHGKDVKEMMTYLKHYVEGVNFSDGIDETDLTREGLRENFAEGFSVLVDENPSEINEIYLELFPSTSRKVREFVL